MFIIYGIYQFKPKTVAYRNDFCLSCAGPRRSLAVRSFEVLHLFFIPLFPLGFRRLWMCVVCRQDPHSNPRSSTAFLWFSVACMGIIAVVAWIAGRGGPVTAVIASILTLMFLGGLWFLVRSAQILPRRLKLKEQLLNVQPAVETTCPLCDSPLMIDDVWRCSRCGVERCIVEV
jgi:hypothetical protein